MYGPIVKPFELLGSSFDCRCGRRHTVPTGRLHYGPEAYDLLLETAGSITAGRKFLIIADERTEVVAGKAVAEVLQKSGAKVRKCVVPDRGKESPMADDATRDWILDRTADADLLFAVGSGVINDLTKWVAFLKKRPFVTVATAASMNGYASANVAATVGGLKVLFPAKACHAVFAHPETIVGAPAELSTAGLGDVLAKSVSSADWKLNRLLFDDYYCQFSVDLLKDIEPVYLENPTGMKEKDPAAFKALFQALFLSGIAMTITGTSAPASGGEHLISHTLDMLAIRDGAAHDLHGRQVGVASILMAALYERAMRIDRPTFGPVPRNVDGKFWGTLSPVVEKEYAKKRPKMERARSFLSNAKNWEMVKSQIEPGLIPAEKLKSCLASAGAAHCFWHLKDNETELHREKMVSVVNRANQMRERFTILDLAVMMGLIPGETEELVDKWITN